MNLKPNTIFIKRYLSSSGSTYYGVFKFVSKETIRYITKNSSYIKAKRMMENYISGYEHYYSTPYPLTSDGFGNFKWFK